MAKLVLFYPDGNEVEPRPSESRLFRPSDTHDDLHSITLTLQEALTREKLLEDKLVRIRTMVANSIGKTHTDMLKLFEKMKQELTQLYEEREGVNANFDVEAFEKV